MLGDSGQLAGVGKLDRCCGLVFWMVCVGILRWLVSTAMDV